MPAREHNAGAVALAILTNPCSICTPSTLLTCPASASASAAPHPLSRIPTASSLYSSAQTSLEVLPSLQATPVADYTTNEDDPVTALWAPHEPMAREWRGLREEREEAQKVERREAEKEMKKAQVLLPIRFPRRRGVAWAPLPSPPPPPLRGEGGEKAREDGERMRGFEKEGGRYEEGMQKREKEIQRSEEEEAQVYEIERGKKAGKGEKMKKRLREMGRDIKEGAKKGGRGTMRALGTVWKAGVSVGEAVCLGLCLGIPG